MPGLIDLLVRRGDYVAIEQGHLVITPKRGGVVPADWLAKKEATIIREIAVAISSPIFQYQRHHTGKFGAKNYSGIMLSYSNVITGEIAHIFFNCEVTRARNTEAGKRGDLLPRGQFRVSDRHAFTRYWLLMGMKKPRRPSEYYAYMGNLKSVYVTGSIGERDRLEKTSVKPLTVTFDELRRMFAIGNSRATYGQATGNLRARVTGKESELPRVVQGFHPISSTDRASAYISNQVGADYAPSSTAIERPVKDHIVKHIEKMEVEYERRKHQEKYVNSTSLLR